MNLIFYKRDEYCHLNYSLIAMKLEVQRELNASQQNVFSTITLLFTHPSIDQLVERWTVASVGVDQLLQCISKCI